MLFNFDHETIEKDEREKNGMNSLNESEIVRDEELPIINIEDGRRRGFGSTITKSPSNLIGPYDRFPFFDEKSSSINPH
eukprot:CAMPEP_0170547756 /NCGR_PEP_ID=MMETSP0211-20121228/6094_1 /TAXON_ID=311385 /ORGANISM="Pseudokeronopsis sp., Strain OXSARD2" /LENGTH=78 /DNA_ID=CAMNT_0010852921 /DNA_START=1281 /DNA_END=1517 /DNA_ORIENTATION=+